MAQGYQFGPFTLDTVRRRLFREGEPLLVPPKALDVLHVLLDNRGRTVDKGDLMSRVWPDAVVEEANLTQSVFMLRRALGDEPSDPRYISTVARRGYRFVGSVSETGSERLQNERGRVHRTTSLEAYHAYLKGRHYWSKRSPMLYARRLDISARPSISIQPTPLRTSAWPSALSFSACIAGHVLQTPCSRLKPRRRERSRSMTPSLKPTQRWVSSA